MDSSIKRPGVGGGPGPSGQRGTFDSRSSGASGPGPTDPAGASATRSNPAGFGNHGSGGVREQGGLIEGSGVPKGARPIRGHIESWIPAGPVGRGLIADYAGAKGDFEDADEHAENRLQRQYITYRNVAESDRLHTASGGPPKLAGGTPHRVTSADLALDLGALSKSEESDILARGAEHAHKYYGFASAAGLWTRGGNLIKALVAFNLRALFSEPERKAFLQHHQIVNSVSDADLLGKVAAFRKEKGLPAPHVEDEARHAERYRSYAKRRLAQLAYDKTRDPRALAPLHAHLANMALASAVAGSYIPFDFGTGCEVHATIYEELQHFTLTYPSKQFHPDPEVQKVIVTALTDYFAAARANYDTHIFGRQRGFHAVDATTGKPLRRTKRIGEGAGSTKAYLDESGRAGNLMLRGKTRWMFTNIEVVPDPLLMFGADQTVGKDVSVVLVPTRPNYTGGAPFIVQRPDGHFNLELHEGSSLPPELRVDNEFFNSNIVMQPFDAPAPTWMGFEPKEGGMRVKQNAADVTHQQQTGGIKGRIGAEYENLKYPSEYIDNGENVTAHIQSVWERSARVLLERAAANSGGGNGSPTDGGTVDYV